MAPLSRDNSIIREIQSEIINDTTPVANILRKVRLASRKLDLADFEQWATNESDGYKQADIDDLPEYRKVGCTPRFWNPYHGWCPIIIDDQRLYDFCHTTLLRESIAEIEALERSDGDLTVAYSQALNRILLSQMQMPFEIRGFIGKTSLSQVINAVKNIVLDWAVDLEKAGIVGAGLGFSASDKKEAKGVTQNIYAQNIGNLGNVSGKSSIVSTVSNSNFSIDSIETYTRQIRECLPSLPEEIRDKVKNQLDDLSRTNASTDPTAIRNILNTIRAVCENATGNLAAEAIVSLIRSIFS